MVNIMKRRKTRIKNFSSMRKLCTSRAITLVTVTLAFLVVASARIRAGTGIGGSESADATSIIPARTALPVLGGDNVGTTETTTPPPGDPNEVIKGILSDDASKPSAPAIVNDITTAGFAQADTKALDADAKSAPVAHMANFAWLAAFAVIFLVLALFVRKVWTQLSQPRPPDSETDRSTPPAAKLDQPRLI